MLSQITKKNISEEETKNNACGKFSEDQELENILIVLADFAIDSYLARRIKTERPILPETNGFIREGGENI